MGLLDQTFKSTAVPYSPRNEQEAWIAVMHASIAVDEVVAEEELEELAQTLASKTLFEGHDVREYYRSVLLAHAELGSKHLIDNSVEVLSAANKSELFALTIELLLADGILADPEAELIRYLTSALDLEEETAQAIVHTKLQQHKDQLGS
jgi:hypothetical protein